jgi:hypothetical protein
MTSFWVRDYQGPSNAGRRPDPHIVRNVVMGGFPSKLVSFSSAQIGSSVRTTTVVIGAGHSGARDEPVPQRTLDRPRGPRAARHRQRVEDRTVGLAALLSPNWQCCLPGYVYDGTDPDGFMTVPEVADFITAYAKLVAAPVKPGTTVTSVSRGDDEYRVTTDQGEMVLRYGRHRNWCVQCVVRPALCRSGPLVGSDLSMSVRGRLAGSTIPAPRRTSSGPSGRSRRRGPHNASLSSRGPARSRHSPAPRPP